MSNPWVHRRQTVYKIEPPDPDIGWNKRRENIKGFVFLVGIALAFFQLWAVQHVFKGNNSPWVSVAFNLMPYISVLFSIIVVIVNKVKNKNIMLLRLCCGYMFFMIAWKIAMSRW